MKKSQADLWTLKEEYAFVTVGSVCMLALFVPIILSSNHKRVNWYEFTHIYQSWGWVLIKSSIILLTIVCFYLVFRILKQYLIISNCPVSKIRSAAQGYIELEGIQAFLAGKSLKSPISKTACTWFFYRIDELRRDSRGNSYWHTIETGQSKDHFMLLDTTGQCIICPEGADIFPACEKTWINPSNNKIRFTERLLEPNEYVYVTGVFRTLTVPASDENSVDKNKKVSELIEGWKQNYQTLLQKFDINKDGKIDENEWNNVVKSAEEQIAAQYPSENNEILNIVSKEGRMLDELFLISSLRKNEILKKIRNKIVFYFIFFVVSNVAWFALDHWYVSFVKLFV